MRLSRFARRAVDLVVLLLVAPVVLPVVVVAAAVIKIDSPGPAFVRLQRLGFGGRPFELIKLRSMVIAAEDRKAEFTHMSALGWPDFKVENDPRVTRAGKWIRKYSLDELPQLWNLLRGEMTLIGPRPCSVVLDHYKLWQTERLEAVPGLVGRWQAEGRGRVDFDSRCRMDIGQSRTRSVLGNMRLVLATAWSVVLTRGAS